MKKVLFVYNNIILNTSPIKCNVNVGDEIIFLEDEVNEQFIPKYFEMLFGNLQVVLKYRDILSTDPNTEPIYFCVIDILDNLSNIEHIDYE